MVNLEEVRDRIVMVQVLGGQPIIGVLDDNNGIFNDMDAFVLKYAVMFQSHIGEDKKMSFVPVKLNSLCKEDAEYFINKSHVIFITGDLEDEIVNYYIDMFRVLTNESQPDCEIDGAEEVKESDNIIKLNNEK